MLACLVNDQFVQKLYVSISGSVQCPPRPQDPYGHYKLACEEALSYYRRKEDGFPWVSLR